ncbi:S49 family peptidase [Candidatus Pacearchaeota archaeon]|nr:S49 family peptidase [Candidatus Pacearchaeota archaeon]
MWLLETGIKERIEKAELAGVVPTAEQQADFIARHEASLAGTAPAIMSVAGDRAQIEIKGVLTNTPNFLAILFGGGNTTYPEIIAAIAAAENDDSISNIILAIDSPGGIIDGLFDTLNAISKTEKPIQAVVSNLAASAAFAIASQADEIIVSNHAVSVGSIGIAVNIPVSENSVTITSTEAPKKRPDVTTAEGVAVVKEELDAIHEIFVEAIATGRSAATGKSFSVNDVNANFGEGATLLAREALKRGMIDSIALEGLQIATSPDSNTTGLTKKEDKPSSTNMEDRVMDITMLKQDHPGAYEAAVQVGVAKERDRATAHLILGREAGAIEAAMKAVEEGTEMTVSMHATYMAAAMKRKDVKDRTDDDVEAGAAAAGIEGTEAQDDVADKVADVVCETLGYEEMTGGAA